MVLPCQMTSPATTTRSQPARCLSPPTAPSSRSPRQPAPPPSAQSNYRSATDTVYAAAADFGPEQLILYLQSHSVLSTLTGSNFALASKILNLFNSINRDFSDYARLVHSTLRLVSWLVYLYGLTWKFQSLGMLALFFCRWTLICLAYLYGLTGIPQSPGLSKPNPITIWLTKVLAPF